MQGKTFLLIHGTWLGGWIWTPVVERLRAAGARAFAPTMTGCGERSHLLTPDVGLATHVQDVLACADGAELGDIILVGHSFAGITLTGAADRLRGRIRRLVFFDALIPTTQRPAAIVRAADGDWPASWKARQAKFIDGYKMDFFAEYPLAMLTNAHDGPLGQSIRRRVSLHPAKQWTDKLERAPEAWADFPRTYWHCAGQNHNPSSAAMYGPAQAPGWDYQDLPFDRMAMLSHPEAIAALLAALD